MIAEYLTGNSFWMTWFIFSSVNAIWYTTICGLMWYFLYCQKIFGTKWKTQIKWPKDSTIFKEWTTGLVCCGAAGFNMALTIYLSQLGYSQLYYQIESYSTLLWGILFQFTFMEIYSWAFHYACHNISFLWNIHKSHHLFPNPTPFAVMADDPLDMFIKSFPIVLIPQLFPTWDGALFGIFGLVNFIYGSFLHGGFDFPFLPSSTSKYLVSPWHHNDHHSGNMKCNFGFFTAFLDILFGTRSHPKK